jgi:hypothetical protein
MATTTKICITAVDNELYIIATQATVSSELCHLKSGYNKPVDHTVVPQSILLPGDYTLVMIGINWAGPQAFKVILTTGGSDTTYTAPASTAIGANWIVAVPITV